MKKINSKKFWGVLLLAGLAFSIPWCLVVGEESVSQGAVLTAVQGEVYLNAGSKGKLEKAQKGMKCQETDTINTGVNGSAELVFADGTALRVEKKSAFVIKRARQEPTMRDYLVQLVKGRLLCNVVKSDKFSKTQFGVKTPVCSAAIRGTVFVADHTSEETDLAVYEGAVEAASLEEGKAEGEQKAVEVVPNTQTTVKKGSDPLPPHPLAAEFEEYRKNIADLFNQRIESLRQNMEEVRRINEEYMKTRSDLYQQQMDQRQKGYQELMEERRKQYNGQ